MPTSPQPKYETKTFHTVRGVEARSVQKWERDGWKLIDRKPGALRIEITMQREKKQIRPLVWVAGGSAFVLLFGALITAGLLTEASTVDEAAPAPTVTVSTKEGAESPAPTPTLDSVCFTKPSNQKCVFGQTAKYLDEGDGVSLDITAKAPEPFIASAEARMYNSRAHEEQAKAHTIYFEVTIKNTSPDSEKLNSFMFTRVTSRSEGETSTLQIDDGDVKSSFGFTTLQPGESYTFKNGWSLDSLDGLEFEVDIDGLSGYSVEFSELR